MNGREAGESLQKPRRVSNCFKDKDEELSFFRDLKKREKDQAASLLQPVSEEFEANGSFGLSRMSSGGRKGAGVEFGKNDYNWLKTPPATPLFPSLEMETNGQELVVQRELPIIQPLSRFAGNLESNKTMTNNRPTTLNSKPKLLPQRHKTPTGRPGLLSSTDKRNMKTAPIVSQKPSITRTDKMKHVIKPIIINSTIPTSISRSTGMENRVSNETPPNLRTTNRPASATRGRPSYQNQSAPQKLDEGPNTSRPTSAGQGRLTYQSQSAPLKFDAGPNTSRPASSTQGRTTYQTHSAPQKHDRPASATRGRPAYQSLSVAQKQDTDTNIRRQSCSPSVARGRRPETDGGARPQVGGSRVQVVGSRMVDKFMNARMSNNGDDKRTKIKMSGSMNESQRSCNGEERQSKIKMNGSLNESSGFGRLMSKNSLDMALKHMEIQRDSSNGRKIGMIHGRKW